MSCIKDLHGRKVLVKSFEDIPWGNIDECEGIFLELCKNKPEYAYILVDCKENYEKLMLVPIRYIQFHE